MLHNSIKPIFFLLIIIAIGVVAFSCGKKEASHVVVNLPTMQCSTCKKNIEAALYRVKGVSFVHVSIKGKIAEIDYDSTKTNLLKLENAITAIGYNANEKQADSTAYQYLKDCCKLPKDQKKNNH